MTISMKQLKEKWKRIVKYWRISYKQANERDRLFIGMFALVMVTYTWWVILVF